MFSEKRRANDEGSESDTSLDDVTEHKTAAPIKSKKNDKTRDREDQTSQELPMKKQEGKPKKPRAKQTKVTMSRRLTAKQLIERIKPLRKLLMLIKKMSYNDLKSQNVQENVVLALSRRRKLSRWSSYSSRILRSLPRQ